MSLRAKWKAVSWIPVFAGMTAVMAAEILPTNVTILTRKDFLGKPFYTVADALEGLPGLNIERDGSPGSQTLLKVRGTTANRTLILIDGTPITKEFDDQVDLTQLPLSMVQRIEVTRGGGSVSYGAEGAGAVVNIVTQRPEKKGLVADIATAIGRDGFKDSSGLFQGRTNIGDVTYAGDRMASGGFQQNEDYKSQNHFAQMTRSFNGNGYIGADYLYQNAHHGGLPNGTTKQFDKWNGHVEQEPVTPFANRHQISQLSRLRLASPKMADGTFYLTVSRGTRDLELRDVQNGPPVRDEESTTGIAKANYIRHGFEAGVEATELKRSIFPQEETKSRQNGAYVLQKLSAGQWTAVPGLRYDKPAESKGLWNPRLALINTPGKHWLLSANATKGFRKPTFDELFYGGAATANAALEPERSQSYDAGVQWSPADIFMVRVTGFYAHVNDLITVSAANQYENAGTEENKGVETEMSLGNDKSRLSANWTATSSQRDTPSSAGFVPSAMTPRSLVTARYDQALPWALTFTNEVRYQSAQFQGDNQTGIKVPSYYTWDMRFAFLILQANVYMAVENVADHHYADNVLTALSPQPSRTFWGGLSIRFFQ